MRLNVFLLEKEHGSYFAKAPLCASAFLVHFVPALSCAASNALVFDRIQDNPFKVPRKKDWIDSSFTFSWFSSRPAFVVNKINWCSGGNSTTIVLISTVATTISALHLDSKSEEHETL